MTWQDWISTSAPSSPAGRLPTRKDEDWRYLSLKWLENWDFTPSPHEKVDVNVLSDGFDEVILVNGRLLGGLPGGWNIEVVRRDEPPSAAFQEWFRVLEEKKREIGAPKDLFEELNALRFPEGLFIDVPRESVPARPLVLRWVNTSSTGTRYPRVWLRAGDRAKVVLVEVFESSSETDAFSLPVTEAVLGSSAKLELTRIARGSTQNSQIGRTRILQSAGSSVESLSVAFGARVVRHNLDLYLTGAGASARMHGLSFTGLEQVADHHTRIDHVVGGCQTQQLYKSVLAGTSRSVFNGQVVIRHDAQKASSEQLHQSLLLSPSAETDSKPQLEIWADDVKATHGSTVGQLNEEEIFYFLSRAIPRVAAESMIRRGFTRDLLMQVSDPAVREWVLGLQGEADQRLTQ